MQEPPETAVTGNPKRQASDSIRGFVYQFWKTVHAWLDLSPDEVLFVEGAEDFDVVSGSEAVVNQVKSTTANLTLRSPDVIQGIKNFWEILGANKGRQIQYRFISTSAAGVEKGSPFGAGKPGVELWNNCSAKSEEVDTIRSFLLKENVFDGALKDVLERTPTLELFQRLIAPMKWDLGSPDSMAVETAVERKLINHGETAGIPPSHAKRVASRLLRHIASVASAKAPRPLYRADFLELFETETRVSVPLAQKQTMQTLGGLLSQAFPSTETLILSGALQTSGPPLPPVFAPREAVVRRVKDLLDQDSLLVLQGSTGMGKTIIAALVVHSQSSFLWADLRGLNAREIAAVLIRVSKAIDNDVALKHVVLDDINLSPEHAQVYERVLIGLVYTLANRRGWLLATSQKVLPAAIERQLSANATMAIPRFEEKEIIELAQKLGCHQDRAKLWSKLIAVQTNSHPQLVHARLLTLSRAGWPQLRRDDLLETPRELTEQRTQTRMLLAELPEDAVQLLYRLSVVGGVFRRDHAVAIGEIEPAVSAPGDAFDSLVGPWVEPVTETYFRLSPLLERAADAVWTPAQTTPLREAVGEALLRCRSLTLLEANTILMLGFVTRSRHLVFVMTNVFLKQRVPFERHVADSIFWVALIKTEPHDRVFPEDPILNWMLRMLQFHVALAAENQAVGTIVECLDRETSAEQMPENHRFARFAFLTQVLGAIQAELPPRRLLYLIAETNKAKTALVGNREEEVAQKYEEILVNLSHGDSSFVSRLFIFVASRSTGPDFLCALISALTDSDGDLRAYFAEFVRRHRLQARLLIDRVWLEEEKRNNPNWERCVTAFEAAIAYGRAFRLEELIDLALRATMIVTEEYLHDRARAFRAFESVGADLALPSTVLIDEHALLLTNDGHHSKALELWASIFPDWNVEPESPDSLPAFARRRAAIAAARLGILEQSSKYFQEGATQAEAAGERVLSAGMVADAAFVEWKQGHNEEAITLFRDVLRRLDQMPNTKDELTSFKLWKLTGQMLNHIRSSSAGKVTKESYAPPIGSASDLNAPDELRELPLSSPDMLWLALLQTKPLFAFRLGRFAI